MKQDLIDFAKQNSWIAGMDKSQGLDGWNNYSGGMDKPTWVVSVGRNRDSDIGQESNFDAALELLGGVGKNVAVERFGHWGCGWFELILVNPKSAKHVKIAKDIKESLKDYPLLDESDYFERQTEYQSNYAEGAKEDLMKALAEHFGLKVSRQLKNIAYELNMECQNYYGDDSCINIYARRKPDTTDINRLENCLSQMEYRNKTSKVFQRLVAAVKAYRVQE